VTGKIWEQISTPSRAPSAAFTRSGLSSAR
jgi:hypothetical protein